MNEYITGDGRLWIRDSSGSFTAVANGETLSDDEMDDYCSAQGIDCVPSADCGPNFQELSHSQANYGTNSGSTH